MRTSTRIVVVLAVTIGFIAIVVLALKPAQISKENSIQVSGTCLL
jgi:hypothetical protein